MLICYWLFGLGYFVFRLFDFKFFYYIEYEAFGQVKHVYGGLVLGSIFHSFKQP